MPGISTTVTNDKNVPVEAEITLDFMVLAQGANAGFFFTLNVNGVDQVQRFSSAMVSIWSTFAKSWTVTIPANTTVTIKPRARIGGSGSIQWGRDASDPGYRTRIITKILGV